MGHIYIEKDDWVTLPYEQRFFLSYAPKPCALASLIVCSIVAIRIFRNEKKMAKMYHRLALGMCVTSAVNSLFFMLASWSVPSGTPGAIHCLGTKNTCAFTGFMHQLGFVVQYYYVSLAVYVYFALSCQFRIREIQWMEKYIHISVFLIPIGTSIGLLSKDMFNSVGFGCYITAAGSCNSDGICKHHLPKSESEKYMVLFGVVPGVANLLLATAIMIACYVNEQKKSADTSNSKCFQGKRQIFERARKQKSQLIARQGMVYLGVFYLSYIFPFLCVIIAIVYEPYYFPVFLLAVIFLPLDGLFFTLSYIFLLSDEDEFVIQSIKRLHKTSCSQRSICDNMTLSHSCTTKDTPVKARHSKISLFDGTDEEKWSMFGVYVGSESSSHSDDGSISDKLDEL